MDREDSMTIQVVLLFEHACVVQDIVYIIQGGI